MYATFLNPFHQPSNQMSTFNQGNILIAKETARRYADKGIVSIAVNPGNIKTEILRHAPPLARRIIVSYTLKLSTCDIEVLFPFKYWLQYPTPIGALTQLYAGTAAEVRDMNGAYFIPWARLGKPQIGRAHV